MEIHTALLATKPPSDLKQLPCLILSGVDKLFKIIFLRSTTHCQAYLQQK